MSTATHASIHHSTLAQPLALLIAFKFERRSVQEEAERLTSVQSQEVPGLRGPALKDQ